MRPALTLGELSVAAYLDDALPAGWEIYLQPHLNGLRPDIVLLHPDVGIAVIEVKDWRLGSRKIWHQDGRLISEDATGHHQWVELNPLAQLDRYRREIAELYCFGLDARAGLAVVGGAVVFVNASTAEARALLVPPEGALTVVGREALEGRVERWFPPATWEPNRLMNPRIADELRHWLIEPDFSAEQREPPELDPRQREFSSTRTDSGYRRIRGPAGAGKSLVPAARATNLQREGRDVLVVSFNHTLRAYLRDLASRFGARTSSMTWLGFHEWAKRVLFEAGRASRYSELFEAGHTQALDVGLAAEAEAILRDEELGLLVPRFDAILVDEGQDFRPEWWNALRLALREGGEMLLVADRAQDVYGQNQRWTEQAMQGAGFRGRWSELEGSYRLPDTLTGHARQFAGLHLALEESELPDRPAQLQVADEAAILGWRQVEEPHLVDAATRAIGDILRESRATPGLVAVADVVALCDRKQDGVALAHALEREGVRCITTFDSDPRVERKKKLSFLKGDARVKVTTIHSYKGWEGRALVVVASDACSAPLLYTALTRLRRHHGGSFLTVVCAANRYAEFGATWPRPTFAA
jgi:hypothetical protein